MRTFMEEAGRPNEATRALKALQEAIGDRVFNSPQELEAFADTFYSRADSRPNAGFSGAFFGADGPPPRQRVFAENEDIVLFHPERASAAALSAVPYIRMARFVLDISGNSAR
jgi:mRNA-degrading endonuclease HigB of HigAB toxin-antitoxin module